MSAHLKEQLLRFARVSALAFVGSLAMTGGKVDLASLWALLPGALESGYRQVFQVAPVPIVTAVPAPVETPPATADPVPPAKG